MNAHPRTIAASELAARALAELEERKITSLVVVDAQGNVTLPFNTEGMYRCYARVGAAPVTAIYR